MRARIRLATPGDGDAVAAIYRSAIDGSPISFETVAPDGAGMAKRIADRLRAYPWLVCEIDGEVVGYAYGAPHRERAAYRWSCEVSVYIDGRHHRRGVGRALYTSVLAILSAQGFINVYAGITLPNPSSVGLHEAMGFTPVGVYHRVGFKLGRWHDVGWWERPLGEHTGSPAEPVGLAAVSGRPGWEGLLTAGEPLVRPAP